MAIPRILLLLEIQLLTRDRQELEARRLERALRKAQVAHRIMLMKKQNLLMKRVRLLQKAINPSVILHRMIMLKHLKKKHLLLTDRIW